MEFWVVISIHILNKENFKQMNMKTISMKKTILTVLMAAMVVCAAAQQKDDSGEMKTLFGNREGVEHGAYGAITLEYSQIDGQDGLLFGARGAWIIDHHIALGFAGKGIATVESYSQFNTADAEYFLSGGYGGLLIEPIIAPFSVVNVSFPVTIGAGGVAYTKRYDIDQYWDNNNRWDTWDASAFFVAEPGVEINLNLIKFMRLSFGGYYRYTAGLSLEDPNGVKAEKDMLNGFSAGISLKFGKF